MQKNIENASNKVKNKNDSRDYTIFCFEDSSPEIVYKLDASKQNKKIIAFSLWGRDPKYTIGAIKNADLSPLIYPDWICRFYISQSVPQNIIDQLMQREHVEIIMLHNDLDWEASLWRFKAVEDENVAVMISRDTDSRLSIREKAAVDEWLASDQIFHIMRDHPGHRAFIMAGMWGVKTGYLKNMSQLIDFYISKIPKRQIIKGIDQEFLADIIYPLIVNKSMVHDEFFLGNPFPVKREGGEYVGQVFLENDSIIPKHSKFLNAYFLLNSQQLMSKEISTDQIKFSMEHIFDEE